MPFQRPTLAELRKRNEAMLAAALELGTILPKSNLAALAAAMAGNAHLLHGHLAWLANQFIPSSKTDSIELERLAAQRNVTRKAAVGATGLVAFTGVGTALVPVGTVLVRADGVEYTVDANTNLVAGAANVAVTAVVDDGESGAATNADVGTPLTLQSAVLNVNGNAVVADQGSGRGLDNGFDLESDQLLLGRLLEVWRNPPHGGSEADYIQWAKEVAGVTRAWVVVDYGGLPNHVGVGFVLDGASPSIIPNAGKITEMQTYLEDPVRKPVSSVPEAFAPTPLSLAVTVAVTPNTSATQASVTTAIADLCLRESALGVPLTLNKIRQAISNAPGVEDHVLTVPSATVTPAALELIVPGTITFA